MQRDWEARARKDAFHYIASWKKGWDAESFLASGEDDYRRMIAPVLQRWGIALDGTILELGCGAGRMTGSLARRWQRVLAYDISQEMLTKAKALHQDANNIVWQLSSGTDLAPAQTGSVDFVFSYIVLQHLPEEPLVAHYVAEMLRVLRPGGVALFQYDGAVRPTMNWRGQVAWKIVDVLWAAGLNAFSRRLARAVGGDPEIAGKTWRGVKVPAERMRGYVRTAGGDIREMTGETTPMAWCLASKTAGGAHAEC